MLSGSPVDHTGDNPLAQYFKVPWAQTTLPINSATFPFTTGFLTDVQEKSEQFYWQLNDERIVAQGGIVVAAASGQTILRL